MKFHPDKNMNNIQEYENHMKLVNASLYNHENKIHESKSKSAEQVELDETTLTLLYKETI